MPKSLKIISVTLLVCSLLALHPQTFAWQQSRPAAESTVDTTGNHATAENAAAEEPEEIDDTEDAFKDANFEKVSTTPSQTKRALDNQQWDRITKDPDFQYDDIKEPVEKPVDYSKSWWVRALGAVFIFFSSPFGKFLIVAVVAGIVLFLVARYFQLNGNVFFSRKNKKITSGSDETSDDFIPENWEQEIAEAARAGNYRLALRHCYRYLLITLSEKELIQFQVAKTNYQYVFELRDTAYHQPFMKLTRDYEYAWYGGFDITENFYANYYQLTQQIQQQLKH